jgi:nucleoside-diphosphate-sugar epimerase
VDGGNQRRCFTDVDDGIDGLIRIIERRHTTANRRIFNLGNPQHNLSIKELAHLLVNIISRYPKYKDQALSTQIIEVSASNYYGEGYQDVQNRVPSIKNAQEHLGWTPKVGMEASLVKALDYHLSHPNESLS